MRDRRFCLSKKTLIFIFFIVVFVFSIVTSLKINQSNLTLFSKAAAPARQIGGYGNPCVANAPDYCNSSVANLFCSADLNFWVSKEKSIDYSTLPWEQTSCRYNYEFAGTEGNLCKSNFSCNPGLSCLKKALESQNYYSYLSKRYPELPDILDLNNYNQGKLKGNSNLYKAIIGYLYGGFENNPYHDNETSTRNFTNICIPESYTLVADCGDFGQEPCPPGNYCFSPNKLTQDKICGNCGSMGQASCFDQANGNYCDQPLQPSYTDLTCQPCGGLGQMGCHNEGKYVNFGYEASKYFKCTDTNMYAWGNGQKTEKFDETGVVEIIDNTCKPLPSREDLLQYGRPGLGFEKKGQKSIRLISIVGGNKSNFFGNETFYNNAIKDVRLDENNRLYNIELSNKKFKTKQEALEVLKPTNETIFKANWFEFKLKFDELSENLDFTTLVSSYTSRKSTLTVSCNSKTVVLPTNLDSSECLDVTQCSTCVFSNFTYEAFKACNFDLKENLIVLQKLHLVFNNGGSDTVYDYDLSKASNNYIKIKFIYNEPTPTVKPIVTKTP